jgi:hypothetical protein
LDGSYEAVPKQLHLQTYFDVAGIKDGIIKAPQLDFRITPSNKLFKKSAIIHYDLRGQGGRNIYGVDWEAIVRFLLDNGYSVFQCGEGQHEPIKGAIEIKTVTLNLLQYVVGSSDLFIGADSGVSHIAVATGVPSVIFFGSVKAEYIHPDLSKVCVIDNGICCDLPKCWHEVPDGTEGMKCYIDESCPPCSVFKTGFVLQKISKFISN